MKAKKILAFLISAGITLQSAPIFAMAEEEVIFDDQILELTPESTADVVIPAEKIIFAEEIPPETEAADANTDLTETVPAAAEEAPVLYAVSGDFEYTVNDDDTATITGFVGKESGDLVIPGEIDGYVVTAIGEGAFEGAFSDCYGFTGSLTIPDSVTTIGNYAFSDCSGFTGSLTIGDSVTSIGNYAFCGCAGFTGSLTIPDSVTSIGNYAFDGCSGFTGSLTIPDSVTSIGNYAFRGCAGFTGSLTIPDSVTSIGDYAFFQCYNFTGNLTIPDSVIYIGYAAFYNCSGFTGSLTIGDSVTSIGGRAFYNCSGFTGSLTIPDSVISIGGSAFNNCSGFTGSLTIGDSVTSIGGSAFYNCSGFTGSLTIGDSVISIGYDAFYSCSGFTGSLTIPDSVTSIGNDAFNNCSGFTGSLTIGDSVTSIGESAFDGCSGFTGSLTIPDSVTFIGVSAFNNCSGFTGSLTIPDSVTSILGSAFNNCSGFTGSLTIPDSVTSIWGSAFNNCSGFTGSLTIPDSVTSIWESAFNNCSGFTGSLTIPDSVTSIGKYAFRGCAGFTGAYFYGDVPAEWRTKVFYNNADDFTIYYPEGNTSGWTSPTWTAPDGTVYNTATFVPDHSLTIDWDTMPVTLTAGESYDFAGEVRSTLSDLYAVHFTVNERANHANGIDYFRIEDPGREFGLDGIPSITAGDVLTGLQFTNDIDSLELVPGEYLIRLWAKDTDGNSVHRTKELTVIEKQIVFPPETAVQPGSVTAGESAEFTLTAYEELTDVYVQFMLTDSRWMDADTCAEQYALPLVMEEDGVYTYTSDIQLNTPGNMYDGNRRYFRYVYTDGEGRVNYTDTEAIAVTAVEKHIELKIISGGTQSNGMIHMNDVKIVLSVVSDDGNKPENVSIDYLDGDSGEVSFYYNKDTRQIIGDIISTPEGEEVLYTLQLNIQYAGDDNIYQITRSLFIYPPTERETQFVITAVDKETGTVVVVPGATVEIYSDRNGKNLVATLPPTDANGRTSYTWDGKYKNLYAVAYKKVASEITEHEKVGKYEKYYLELRSDTIEPSNGNITIDQIHGGMTMHLLLDRPKFHLNLTVAYFVPENTQRNRERYKKEDAFQDYFDEVKTLMQETNKRLLETTDGYFCINEAYIFPVNSENDIDEIITKHDINIHYTKHAIAGPGSFWKWKPLNGIHIGKYPQELGNKGKLSFFENEEMMTKLSKALVHEMGHFVFVFLDEYLSGNFSFTSGEHVGDWIYDIDGEYDDGTDENSLGHNAKKYFGLMQHPEDSNWEMSTASHYKGYLSNEKNWKWNKDILTAQYVNSYNFNKYMSCWEWLQSTYFNCYDGHIECDYAYEIIAPVMKEVPLVASQTEKNKMVFASTTGSKYQTARTFSSFNDNVTIYDLRNRTATKSGEVLFSDEQKIDYDVNTPIAYAGVVYDTEEQVYKVKLIPQLSGDIHLYNITDDRMEIPLAMEEDGCLYGTLDYGFEDRTYSLFEMEMKEDSICYFNKFSAWISDSVLEYNTRNYSSGSDFSVAFSFETMNRFIITEMDYVHVSTDTLNKGSQPYYIAVREDTDYIGTLFANVYDTLDLTTLAWYRFEDSAWKKCESKTDISMDGVVVSASADIEGLYMILGEPASEENTLSVITDLQAIPVDTIDGGILFTFTDNNDAEEVLGYSVYYSKTPFTDTNDALYYPNLFTDSIITLTFPEAGCEYYLAAIIHGLDGSISELSEVVSCVSGVHMMEGSDIPVSWQQKYCLWDIPGEIIDDKDNDGDGLTNLEEYLAGTDPLAADDYSGEENSFDTNGDGITNEADVLYLLRHTILPERYPLSVDDADYDGSGTVDAKDAVYLQKCISGFVQ